jgi:hypothetical protein
MTWIVNGVGAFRECFKHESLRVGKGGLPPLSLSGIQPAGVTTLPYFETFDLEFFSESQ